jgi:hypothetical protein
MPEPKEIGACPICERPLIAGPSINEHHLKPKTYKGTETITLHVVCHTKIHSIFSERELYDFYHTVERLRDHPEMDKFIKWIKKQPPEYKDRNRLTNARRARVR